MRRAHTATLAGLLAVLFALVAAVVHLDWQPAAELDHSVGTSVRVSTVSAVWMQDFWLWVGRLTDTPAMTIYTTLIVLALLIRGQRRLAAWVAGTMTTVGLLNALLKTVFARNRPEWDDPLQLLTSYSFPSGHASGIAAFAGVMIVLVLLLADGHQLARAVVTTLAAVLVALVGFDRLALGVHNLSDVIAGWVLGAAVVFAWLTVLPPESSANRPPNGSAGQDGILSA